MRVLGSSFDAWKSLEANSGTKQEHGLVFPLAVVAAIAEPFGVAVTAEEESKAPASEYDAVFISVLDSRCMVPAWHHFRRWGIPFRRTDRTVGAWPLIWAGGQGLHNPCPLAPVADIIVIGDAEGPLPTLLGLWHRHGNSAGFLAAAATVPGVFVPAHHDRSEARIVQSVAPDIGITLRQPIVVSHNGSRRVEIARGCRSKCTYCSLGWRAQYRENSADAVLTALQDGPKCVHLQAGDAEGHSEIGAIRTSLTARGVRDDGWTGRLDSCDSGSIASNKRYAFGVESPSYRVRRAIGKAAFTDEFLISSTCDVFAGIDGDGKGRTAWHMIAGLPTDSARSIIELGRVLEAIDNRRRGTVSRNLSVHWQPFQPLPGTPMQWCAAGSGARKMASLLRPWEKLPWCRVRQQAGRGDEMALVCAVLARADERGAGLLEALAARDVSPAEASAIAGVSWGALDSDAPLPWDFVRHAYSRDVLRRAHSVMIRRLSEVGS